MKKKVWTCLANALVYTIWEAYQYEGEIYLPQTIENVDYETLEDFIKNFNLVYTDSILSDKLLTYFEMNYSKNRNKQIDIDAIKDFINSSI